MDALLNWGHFVYAIDAESYAANINMRDSDIWITGERTGALKYKKADICILEHLPDVDAIIHCAAETHVDNSIMDASRFVQTNVVGTHRLLEIARAKRNYQMPLFLHISTDEVYGSIATGMTTEASPLNPSSPYAASKAAADYLVSAYGHTFGIPYRIMRPSNCYGERQYPEKLIPKAVKYLSLGKPIPIHEGGNAIRSWLHVKDCVQAILTVLDRGENGHIYNIGGNTEMSVRGIATAVIDTYGGFDNPAQMLEFGYTRLGLDARYYVDDTKLRALGWVPQGNFATDLTLLVQQERANIRW